MTHVSLIEKFLVTEKSTALNDLRKYVFAVKPEATKNEIKKAVKELYHVDAVSVNMLVRKGKVKRFRNIKNVRSGMKKAIVTLAEGQKIDVGR